jgi:hypothetical protein
VIVHLCRHCPPHTNTPARQISLGDHWHRYNNENAPPLLGMAFQVDRRDMHHLPDHRTSNKDDPPVAHEIDANNPVVGYYFFCVVF